MRLGTADRVCLPVELLYSVTASFSVYVVGNRRDQLRSLVKAGASQARIDAMAQNLRVEAAELRLLRRAILRARGKRLPADERWPDRIHGRMRPFAANFSDFGSCASCAMPQTSDGWLEWHGYPVGGGAFFVCLKPRETALAIDGGAR